MQLCARYSIIILFPIRVLVANRMLYKPSYFCNLVILLVLLYQVLLVSLELAVLLG